MSELVYVKDRKQCAKCVYSAYMSLGTHDKNGVKLACDYLGVEGHSRYRDDNGCAYYDAAYCDKFVAKETGNRCRKKKALNLSKPRRKSVRKEEEK